MKCNKETSKEEKKIEDYERVVIINELNSN